MGGVDKAGGAGGLDNFIANNKLAFNVASQGAKNLAEGSIFYVKEKFVEAKAGVQQAGKELNCIVHPDNKDCPDVTAAYAAKSDDARKVIEGSPVGKALKDGLLNADNHRKVLEKGNAPGVDNQ